MKKSQKQEGSTTRRKVGQKYKYIYLSLCFSRVLQCFLGILFVPDKNTFDPDKNRFEPILSCGQKSLWWTVVGQKRIPRKNQTYPKFYI